IYFLDFCHHQFAAFDSRLLSDVIVVQVENIESLAFLVLKSSPSADPIEGGIPALARRLGGGRKPECPGVLQFIKFWVEKDGCVFALFRSVVASDAQVFIS